jgi:hypothetical protein
MSEMTIQLPDSILGKLREQAAVYGTSVEQIVVAAAGEKLAAMLKGSSYLQEEGAQASQAMFREMLSKVPDVEPDPLDRMN